MSGIFHPAQRFRTKSIPEVGSEAELETWDNFHQVRTRSA